MPRAITVRVGRLPAPQRTPTDGLGASDSASTVATSARSLGDSLGMTDSVTPELNGGGAVFGGNFGGNF